MICSAILSPIVVLVRTLISIVREVVHVVCEWVSSIITVIKEVTKKVCSWLPWPLNKICDWVTELIAVLETVWDWVCTEVIERIIEWIEIIVEYVIYVLKWVCWVIDWGVRLPGLLLCLLGVEPGVMIGRQLQEGDVLYSFIPEADFRKLKGFKELLSKEERELLKEIAQIMRRKNPVWGV